jgi:glucose dehydrogenase
MRRATIACCMLSLAACQRDGATRIPAPAPLAGSTGASADFAPDDPPGEWRRQARDYANTRYSPLGQINTGNVGRLKVAWSFADGISYGHEAAPLVVGDTMFIVTPYPNVA